MTFRGKLGRNNKIFLGLIFFILLLATCQSYKYISKIYYYYSLNQETIGEITSREVVQKKKNQYQILVGLHFLNQGEEVESKALFPKVFLNPWAAEDALKKMTLDKIPIFFSAKNPALVEMKRDYPTHALVSFLILMMILFYFLLLKIWFEKEEKKNR